MARVLGVDASLTGTGVVELVDGEFSFSQRIEPKKKGVERLLEIENKLSYILTAGDYDLVILEGYAFARANQAHQIGELGGVIRRLFHLERQRWIEASPSQVKKFATGTGTAKKDVVLMNVFKRWGLEFKNSDEADAFVLAKIGSILLGDENRGLQGGLTAKQMEVIKALEGVGVDATET